MYTKMASQLAEAVVHAAESSESLVSSSSDVPVSVDLIDERLYLGNLTAGCDRRTRERLGLTHVLTVDAVPLPRTVLQSTSLCHKYVKMADVPKEDMISHLPETNDFIHRALEEGGTVLVHCYFGVSRSAGVVIAHIMSKYGLCYEEAFQLVRSKRRFVGPNVGFVAQLKLFGHMGCRLDRDDPRYRQFRLKMAGQKLKDVKILPQLFADLVKPDPGLVRERPDPVVYRCKKCRRVVASQRNLIPHLPHQLKVERAKRVRPASSGRAERSVRDGDILMERLQRLSVAGEGGAPAGDAGGSSEELLVDEAHNEYEGTLVDTSIAARSDCAESCRNVYFVEPMAWMQGVQHSMQGKLHCPGCAHKLGSFSWVMGCKCPCGQKVAPAFYLVPSKVEWSNVVQNVQITV